MESLRNCSNVKMESYNKYNLEIQKITKNILANGDYEILNIATGVTWRMHDPYKIYDCLKKHYEYRVHEPGQKTNIKANKK